MPRILINEVDMTSAGTPGNYSNYAVLITGYMGTPDTTKGKVIEVPNLKIKKIPNV